MELEDKAMAVKLVGAAGTDPADFASAIVWCKQFSHLFAVAPLAAV
jgi:hypothetical protein